MREFCGHLLSLGEILRMHFILRETKGYGLAIFHLSLLPHCIVCVNVICVIVKCEPTEVW